MAAAALSRRRCSRCRSAVLSSFLELTGIAVAMPPAVRMTLNLHSGFDKHCMLSFTAYRSWRGVGCRPSLVRCPSSSLVSRRQKAVKPASVFTLITCSYASFSSSSTSSVSDLSAAAVGIVSPATSLQQPQPQQQQQRGDGEEKRSAEDESSSSSSAPASSSWWYVLLSPLINAWRWYLSQLSRRPYSVQMLTSATLFAIGDITAQHYEAYLDYHRHMTADSAEHLHHHELHPAAASPSAPFNFHRLAACSLFGLLVMGPAGHLWYQRLDLWAARVAAPLSLRHTGFKVLLDTAIFNPIFLVVFFVTVSSIEGESRSAIASKLWRDFVPSYAVDCSVWPAVQCINFRYVPVALQLLVVNVFCYFDDVFLSYVQHNGMPAFFVRIEQAWLQYIGEKSKSQLRDEREDRERQQRRSDRTQAAAAAVAAPARSAALAAVVDPKK